MYIINVHPYVYNIHNVPTTTVLRQTLENFPGDVLRGVLRHLWDAFKMVLELDKIDSKNICSILTTS